MTNSPVVAKVTAVIAASIWVIFGVWLTGNLTPTVYAHGAAIAAFVAVTAAAIWIATRTNMRELRWFALGGALATLVLAMAFGAFLSRPNKVNEDIVKADAPAAVGPADTQAAGAPDVPAEKVAKPKPQGNVRVASGSFKALAHPTTGNVEVIKLANGSSKLTLSGFRTDPGPDLFVYAFAGSPEGDDDVNDFIDLGRLKGNEGNQQYSLPKNFDASKYSHVYIWCRAFTVGFGRAKLGA